MEWTALLERELTDTYRSAFALIDMADDSMLGWKPATGENWMAVGQLLRHLTDACGAPFKGFATGDWGLPPDFDPNELTPEQMLPPAEAMPSVGSVAEAKALIEEDRRLAFDILAGLDDETLGTKKVSVFWDPREEVLGLQLLHMVEHLAQHRAQLFYYLKLLGKPVNTSHLWS